METKPLLFGLIGFFIGGFLVSVAATTFDKPETSTAHANTQMVASLKDKSGDDYDKAFIEEMIVHHQGAVEMAKLSAENAKHEKIKKLSGAIVSSQEQEISEMKQWQKDWGYSDDSKMSH
jgi:uncharacterized protein (DUF305 family)